MQRLLEEIRAWPNVDVGQLRRRPEWVQDPRKSQLVSERGFEPPRGINPESAVPNYPRLVPMVDEIGTIQSGNLSLCQRVVARLVAIWLQCKPELTRPHIAMKDVACSVHLLVGSVAPLFGERLRGGSVFVRK